ncbi:MAG: UvrD-helicase domain-containing protein [Rickettsiales bacterium]|nr:UvrD-helicase domain-containing protein [Rickettsiales bacterium]
MQELNRNNASKKPSTIEQKKVTNPLKSFWVTANAGTGKTKVLIDRLMSLIFYENNPEKILCITFTKAGANEMIERLTKECRRYINLSEDEIKSEISNNLEININKLDFKKIRKTLNKIIDNPNLIKIQTIHSLCGSILKNFPLEAGIVPFFDVIDEIKAKEYLEKSWQNLINKKPENANENLIFLLQENAPNSIRGLLITLLYNQDKIDETLKNYKSVNEYISNLSKQLDVDLDFNFIENFFNTKSEILEKFALILQVNSSDRDKTNSSKILNAIKNSDFYEIEKIFSNKLEGAKVVKNNGTALDLLEEIRFSINLYSDNIKTQNLLKKTYSYLNIFEEFSKFYNSLKNANYQLDYNDLIIKTQKLLDNSEFASWVLYKLDGGINHILVDEAQDTSPAQWNIVKSLTSEFFVGETNINKNRTIFVVGDEKQSIFSFQGADIENFYDVKNYFSQKIKTSNNFELEKISLNLSFRSLPAILNFVDKLSEIPEIKHAISEIEILHKPSRLKHFGYVEVNNLIVEEKKEKAEIINWYLADDYEESPDNKNLQLAKKITEKIDKIVNETHILPSTLNQAKASDIIILFRKRNEELINFVEVELQKIGIKCSGLDKAIINENVAILDLVSAIKFIINQNDDYNTACLLKSCFIGVSEEVLQEICIGRNEKSIYKFLQENSNKQEYKSSLDFLSILEKNKFIKPSDLSFYLLETLGFKKNFISNFGNKASEIFEEFFAILNSFERNENISLTNFINWFEKNSSEIKRVSKSENQVRIMTCHSSKGLEAPIVIIADSASETKNDSNYFIDKNYIFAGISAQNKCNFIKGLQESDTKKDFNESMRLLYVALTRARDELYIFGIKPHNSKQESWHQFTSKAISLLPETEKFEDKFIYTNQEYINFTKQKINATYNNNNKIEIPKFLLENYIFDDSENKILPSLLNTKNYSRDEVNLSNVNRGNIIHKLLEILPNFTQEKWAECANIIFNDFNLDDKNLRNEYFLEVEKIIINPELKYIFSKNSLGEVEISGVIENKFVNGKIDRLIIDEANKTAVIIDFKTHQKIKNENSLLENYQPQMKLYYELIRLSYPDFFVKTGLLFTALNKVIFYNFDE